MKVLATLAVVACILGTSCFAGTVPTATWHITVGDVVKEYSYTLTNDLDSAEPIQSVGFFMPEAGARAVTQFSCSRPNWFSSYSFRGDYSSWVSHSIASYALPPGENLVITLTTARAVPTAYDFGPPTYPSNWAWTVPSGGYFGDYNMPVPAPEPPALVALAGGLGALGVGGLRLRRRR